MYLFEGLKKKISEYLPPADVALVQKAYVVAREAHEGQFRSSGEPYITHPVEVTQILASMKLDHETLMAALMHDVIEDTDFSQQDLAEIFGETVAELVEGVSKLDKLSFKDKKEFQAENYRKMIMAMTQDIRVILIKLADRTHNMRTLGALRPDKRRRIARETLEIFAPIANRLGIHDIKNELEDLGFQALYPMRYRALKSEVAKARGNRKEVISNIQGEIESRLEDAGIQAQVSGREKHLYSIYKKMLNKELMFNEVMDIYAFRIVVDSMDTCYRVLGVAHNLYKPIETRFKDYIAVPKTNGYQSLHTSLVGPHGIPVEIQIRTLDMDHMADKGVAAHWMYKKAGENTGHTAQQRARQWMQSLLELQQSAGSSFEFVENVKTELFPEEIYVFTPDGRIIELPMGATAVDFAYAVHTDVGNTCVGARVNRKPHPLSRPLDTGQTVEVITSSGAHPNATWLNFIVTAKARLCVRNYLKSQRQEEAMQLGRRLLDSALGEHALDEIGEERITRVLEEHQLNTLLELLVEIGCGNIMSMLVAKRLLQVDEEQIDDLEKSAKAAIIGTEGMLVNYSKCCRPVPGDAIVAHVSQGKGLTVHRQECKNIRGWQSESSKYFVVKWEDNPEKEYIAALRVEIINHQGVLAKLTNLVASTGANIVELTTDEKESNLYVIDLGVTVKDRIHVANIMRRIRVMPDVQKVYRKK
ncbi:MULTISPECIES: bifunctional GTP diphosphokinase/guanosine-3',5'-bis pyrophosphate 3'-pyrophosphohydrolase [Pseudoalteromonas]|uniref:guanosine-3',5'-bis(diphosphate) 3'-diphosphatase n=1 Tax=Pseudoalteromonas ruthenica TaxID=151081 RepID=A0A0F4PUM0_9GAMM|nr:MULTISPECIES: bifunctional GTP diphosphokinase/guanosine-3',5'-bis pyrophosphate 3'-pyrophosphohydrolase [Pseudoalteromonas]KJY97956.1 guanosine-3',5'-bis(diphosphate) 3'-pyrophosphohydrolase [Pseudoalteromonas ruthenica]KJZ01981.1 guanosine-3',5'-bis(diphosphate) 3'-pyrophosphohydrolase [Pseudoalteromonas ruthenica]MCF2862886.1 bifunctional GTP diphosphokinase/guanosine-3',5'-bis pyrophosphate 3'-pyrophosphohydrolase [Pseudoalteromonas sp. CNAT2-18]MCG7543475.1 bifunctional GTP diphosphokin|tara:strand:+ start:2371 stop:4476 length:2106 start_codon:yes stop_codon:yes gene_type:complete